MFIFIHIFSYEINISYNLYRLEIYRIILFLKWLQTQYSSLALFNSVYNQKHSCNSHLALKCLQLLNIVFYVAVVAAVLLHTR